MRKPLVQPEHHGWGFVRIRRMALSVSQKAMTSSALISGPPPAGHAILPSHSPIFLDYAMNSEEHPA